MMNEHKSIEKNLNDIKENIQEKAKHTMNEAYHKTAESKDAFVNYFNKSCGQIENYIKENPFKAIIYSAIAGMLIKMMIKK